MGISPCALFWRCFLKLQLYLKRRFRVYFAAFSFGLGTFISGFIIISGLSGVIAWFPKRFLKSNLSLLIYRAICALFLILLGISLMFSRSIL